MQKVNQLKYDLLHINGCILAEDDDNLVVSLTLSKLKLREYHGILAALSDHVSISDHAWSRARTLRRWPHFISRSSVVVAGALFGATLLDVAICSDTRQALWGQPPFVAKSLTVLSGPDDKGRLRVKGVAEIEDGCQHDVDRMLLRGGEVVFTYERKPMTPQPDGLREWVFTVTLPPHLPPGDYVYRSRVNSTCGRELYAAVSPDVPFTIRASTSSVGQATDGTDGFNPQF